MSNTEPTNGTPIAELARVLYEQNRGKEGRPWEHTNAATREKWEVRAAKKAAEHAVELSKPKPPGTRKYNLAAVAIDFSQSHEVVVPMPAGGIVRQPMWIPKEQRVALQPSQQSLQLVLIVEFDPEAKPEPRRFVALLAGGFLETHLPLAYIGFTLNPTNGQPMCLYEVMQPAEIAEKVEKVEMLPTLLCEEPNE